MRYPGMPPDLDKVPWINLRVGFGRYGDLNRSFPSRPHRLSEIILDFYGGPQPLVVVSILNPPEPLKNLTALIGGGFRFPTSTPGSVATLQPRAGQTARPLSAVLSLIPALP